MNANKEAPKLSGKAAKNFLKKALKSQKLRENRIKKRKKQ